MIEFTNTPIETPSLPSLFHLTDRYRGICLFSAGLEDPRKNWEITGINPIIVLTEEKLRKGSEATPVSSPMDELDKLTDSLNGLPGEIGLLGYLSYDFKDRLEEKGLFTGKRQGIFQDFYFVLCEYYILTNRDAVQGTLYQLKFDFTYDSINVTFPEPSISRGINSLDGSSRNRTGFSKDVDKTIDYIRRGDIYQANITRSLHGTTTSDPVSLALSLASSNRIEYGVFAHIPGGHVISTSPELFFKTEDSSIMASPIKGTSPRSSDTQADRKSKDTLLNSEKERAELAMITDLLRNDLSRVSEPGSVRVSSFPLLMELRNVYHLYTEVTGRISHNASIGEILSALFPGGSITGCPKIRACQIIEEIEGKPRGIYTGSFGIIKPEGNAVFNIMIRSLFLQGNRFFYNIGGGITVLSQGNDEYDETCHKGENICRAMSMKEKE